MINLTEMWQKIKLKYKWRSGRSKVIKRYEKIMPNFPQPPICEDGEDFELYSERVAKHLVLLCRCMRLNNIAIRYYDKEVKFWGLATRISYLITFLCIALYIAWKLGVF